MTPTQETVLDSGKKYIDIIIEYGTEYGLRIVGAVVTWIVGSWIIKKITGTIKRSLTKSKRVDDTMTSFLTNLLTTLLKVMLVIAILGNLGVDTTQFAAIIAAAGLAIGLSLQGSLANFAGGVLILFFKPFRVGELIEAQGEIGVVKDIQIFTTTLSSPQNQSVFIPNGALSNGNIKNYSRAGTLRIDHTIGVSYDADIKQTKEVLMRVLTAQENVLQDPAPTVNVEALGESSVDFAVRPWVKAEHYWDVYFQTLEDAKVALDAAGIEIPYPHSVEIQKEG